MYPSEDTIAAISTPPGRSGIGVIRLSGPAAREIARMIFHPKSESADLSPRRATFGEIRDPHTGDLVDEAIVTFFPGPHSYTGEDLVELSCHGSPVVLRRVLELVLERGARAAGPGEFTLRAFLNGRLDLVQAEAIRDLIEAQTITQARVALRQMQGSLSRRLHPIRQALVDAIVQMETAVEFVEDDVMTESRSALMARLEGAIAELDAIAAQYRTGRIVREGIHVAIVGKPNVGKSSLFNRLLERERAIVTEIPGTTRDMLIETASIAGVPVHLVDTAGLREASDRVERLGIERSRQAIADADLVLVVLDGSQPLDADDRAVLEATASVPRLIAINKCDLPERLDPQSVRALEATAPLCRVSALTGQRLDELRQRILEIITSGSAFQPEDVILTNARHHRLIVAACERLREAHRALEEGYSEEVALVGLHDALRHLGEITGEVTIEDILDQIFSTFCIGK
ncbi:MAG: tRNA uridine-5-carboxymethylaminomethyl(34) synthesis GTPase MnmE [Blastocatellia bacterium]|nr:tRNA uridine-5-carboxymethylaminomethyl(34) synthesis GTPase MnmE [Blastocatellia bacterium]MCS7158109.1 tRNA uridine-5-carboxymethylaminomethyl(34) synthesis GTPase MnmE [Blastocatellia bacterium]MCX7753028.1 tRNA uridine-5-carboxymethylaminomethyl(34) synthesis GTPase MnmE [Blastocatellia bacterium]MDW8168551.1 tRNA uridine-5-carboxymethylaminomethyl(34) synthesis GTPase MnmE [Acidobacteriota bacterium]MDW8257286.1 tRNA uridine-5-carboxymethylaminomethyl(34) synthesis GTPase MnmE [Acidobac